MALHTTQRWSYAKVPGIGSTVVRLPHPILGWAIYSQDPPRGEVRAMIAVLREPRLG